MKALNQLNRRHKLAAVPLPDGDFNYHPRSLEKPSQPRLRAVSAREAPSPSDSRAVDDVEHPRVARNSQMMFSSAGTNRMGRAAFNNKVKRITTPMLTTEEFIQVRLATVRESTRHRFWPADVLAKFSAADVIR